MYGGSDNKIRRILTGWISKWQTLGRASATGTLTEVRGPGTAGSEKSSHALGFELRNTARPVAMKSRGIPRSPEAKVLGQRHRLFWEQAEREREEGQG